MYFAQLLKIIFIAIIIYWIIKLFRFLIGIGSAVNAGRAEADKRARRDDGGDGPRMRRDRNGTIELDKDQYRVE